MRMSGCPFRCANPKHREHDNPLYEKKLGHESNHQDNRAAATATMATKLIRYEDEFDFCSPSRAPGSFRTRRSPRQANCHWALCPTHYGSFHCFSASAQPVLPTALHTPAAICPLTMSRGRTAIMSLHFRLPFRDFPLSYSSFTLSTFAMTRANRAAIAAQHGTLPLAASAGGLQTAPITTRSIA